MTNLKNYKKDFLIGEISDLKLFVEQLDSLPKGENGLSDLRLIVSNILHTPISSIFCNGKFKISELIPIVDVNGDIIEHRVRFEIYYGDGICYKQFEKLTDELYLRFELKNKLSEIGLVENLKK